MSAVFSPLQNAALEEVCKAFGVAPLRQAQAVAGGSVNTIYRLMTARGVYYLRLEEVKAREELQNELAFVVHLAQRGFATPAPQALVGKSSEFLLVLNDRLVSLFPQQHGEQCPAAQWNAARFSAVGQALANLHQLSQSYPKSLHDRFGLPPLWNWFENLKSKLPAKDSGFVELLDDEFTIQQKRGRDVAALPQGVVHGDLFADNVFFNGDAFAGVIDFDAAASRELIYDLATAFNALCFRDTGFDGKSAAAFTRGYEMLRPLTDDERRLFLGVWRASSLRFAVTRIKDYELRLAGSSGLEYRDYRDFCRRLAWQRSLNPEDFWKEMQQK